MDKTVLLLAGLPGCGKTTYLIELTKSHWLKFDDFKNEALGNSREFRKSRWFADLLARLREGRRCVVADIDFCCAESRAEAEGVLRVEVPSVEVRWLYFSNDPTICEMNIRRRDRPSLQKDLEALYKYAALYRIPYGADERPCYRVQ